MLLIFCCDWYSVVVVLCVYEILVVCIGGCR